MGLEDAQKHAAERRSRGSRMNPGETTDTETQSRANDRANVFSVRPAVLLAMFTSLSFFLYFDRGVFGALLDDMKDAFHLNNLKAGICSSAYLVCYCVSSPIFAQVAKYWQPLRLCSIGMIVWVFAVVCCGLSLDFVTLMLARSLTGIGEASFLVMAAPFIDFFAPPASRSTWLAIFYSAIPIGYAFGAGVGGAISSSKVFGHTWTWRSVYFLEGICVLPCIIMFASVRGPKSMLAISEEHDHPHHDTNVTVTTSKSVVVTNTDNYTRVNVTATASATVSTSDAAGSAALETPLLGEEKPKGAAILDDLKQLAGNTQYILIVLGYAAQTFFVGAVALYAISYLEHEFDLSNGTAGLVFGGITAFTGLIGSALGGISLDKLKPSSPTASIAQCEVAAHRLIVFCCIIGAPASMLAFVMKSVGAFVPLLVVAELSSFMTIGPINSATVWCVPIPLQPTACAISNLFIHLLGDALSPIVIGALADSIGQRTALFFASCALVISSVVFIFGLMYAVGTTVKERRGGPTLLEDM